jgi:WD40 repeat protein
VSAAGFWDSDIGELKVWDGETLSLIRTIECHPVAKVAITADGRQAISASFDHTLKVWDLDSGLCRGTLAGHRDQVEDVAVSGDGARALSVSADGTVRVWDTKRLRDLYTLVVARREEGEEEGEEGEEESTGGFALRTAGDEKEKKWERVAGCVALTGGDKRAVVGFHDGTLELLDFDTGAILGTLVGHKEGVEAVASTVDGGRAVSASDDGILKLWNLNTGLELRTLVRQPDYFHAVAVSRDGRRAASASDRNLKLWDLDKGELINEYICDGEVTSCAFLDESRIVAGDAGGRVHFFRLEENQSTVY